MATTARKIVLITGANTGLGFAIVKALAGSAEPYHILLGSRSLERGNDAVAALNQELPDSASSIVTVQIDISSDESIQAAFELVQSKFQVLDVLVNNAGISLDIGPSSDLSIRERWNKTYDVNVSGTHVVTHTFAPLLIKSSDPRLLFLTSGLANLHAMTASNYPSQGPVPAGWPKSSQYNPVAYRSSKVALNAMMLSWHWELKEDGVKVWSIAPGMLATGLGGQPEVLKARGFRDPALGGNFIRDVIEGKRDDDVGKAIDSNGIQTW